MSHTSMSTLEQIFPNMQMFLCLTLWLDNGPLLGSRYNLEQLAWGINYVTPPFLAFSTGTRELQCGWVVIVFITSRSIVFKKKRNACSEVDLKPIKIGETEICRRWFWGIWGNLWYIFIDLHACIAHIFSAANTMTVNGISKWRCGVWAFRMLFGWGYLVAISCSFTNSVKRRTKFYLHS